MIEQKLRCLGLSDHDVQVYLTVLRYKRILPALIARETGINRSTVYCVIKSLARRGLLIEDLGGKSTYVVALPPEHLTNTARKDRLALASKERLIKEATEELASLVGTNALPIPKIRYIEENDLGNFFDARMPEWHASVQQYDNTWWGFQDHTLVEKYEKNIDRGWRIAPEGLKLKMLSNSTAVEDYMKKKGYADDRTIRSVGESAPFTASVEIAGDYTIMISTRTDPHYLIEMHDPLLSQNYRVYFSLMWERG